MDLSILPVLRFLVLTLQLDASTAHFSPLNWLITTLSGCPSPSLMEEMKFLLRAPWRQRDIYGIEWGELDALFHPVPGARWPKLRSVVFHWKNIPHFSAEYLKTMVLAKMPSLARSELVKFKVEHQDKSTVEIEPEDEDWTLYPGL